MPFEWSDRYGGMWPDPETVCKGPCEGMGWVPIGEQFKRCPDCNGSGKSPLFESNSTTGGEKTMYSLEDEKRDRERQAKQQQREWEVASAIGGAENQTSDPNWYQPPKQYSFVRVVNEPMIGPTEHVYGPFTADEVVTIQRRNANRIGAPFAIRVDHGKDFQLRD